MDYNRKKDETALDGLNKIYLLMEKQHNRGQDGAVIATIKLNVPPGQRYISRYRSMAPRAVTDIFEYVRKKFDAVRALDPKLMDDCDWLKNRSEEHTSELQSLMRISYAVFCLKKKSYQASNTCSPYNR